MTTTKPATAAKSKKDNALSIATLDRESQLKADDKRLEACVRKVKQATEKFTRSFVDFIVVVGPLLDEAHETYCSRRNASWGFWCDQNLGWSKRHADNLRKAYQIVAALKESGVVCLPTSEKACRVIARVGEDNYLDAWRTIVEVDSDPSNSVARQILESDERFASFFPSSSGSSTTTKLSPVEKAKQVFDSLTPKQKKELLAEIGGAS